jgi:hypothetical protein
MKTAKACALGLAIALIPPSGPSIAAAAAAPVAATPASFDPEGTLAAPFSPSATIYRPDCWTKEDGLLGCGSDRI